MKRILVPLLACAFLAPAVFAADAAPAVDQQAAPTAKPVKLGTVKIDGVAIVVSRLGDEVAGKDLCLELHLPANAAAPKAIHVWTSAESETKALAAKDKSDAKAGEKGAWMATIKLPAKIESSTNLWITVDPAHGKPVSRSMPLKG
jgi:hypothetical protein